MNYTDLKIAWDQQTEQPLFTIDHDTLVASVENKCHTIEKQIKWAEWIMIISSLVSGLGLTLQALLSDHSSWICLVVGIILLIECLYTWLLLIKRSSSEQAYGQAILPSIEKAIRQNQQMAKLLKRWLIFFHIPAALLALFGLLLFPEGMTPWIWALFIGIVSYSIWDTPRYLRDVVSKEKEELEAIRSCFLEAD